MSSQDFAAESASRRPGCQCTNTDRYSHLESTLVFSHFRYINSPLIPFICKFRFVSRVHMHIHIVQTLFR